MEQRYIANNMPVQALASLPSEFLTTSLEKILKSTPPLQQYTSRQSGGLFSGYTGLAYLFLQLSASYPDLRVLGYDLRFWAEKYIGGSRGDLVLSKGNCGLACEKLAYEAVRACLSGNNDDVVDFLTNIPMLLGPYPPVPGDPFSCEIVYGRAGALYMLRMIRHWVPGCESFLNSAVNRLSDMILNTDDDGRGNWEWHGKRYFGAAHGEIGIITQLVLTRPELAPELDHRLQDLLDLQGSNGNWPSSESSMREGKENTLVQWCHGAPGFILSLRALRPHFPNLQGEIDDAIAKAQDLVWSRGILIKEPSLCHGLFGNAL
jgi:lantibiotic modifying enzyme